MKVSIEAVTSGVVERVAPRPCIMCSAIPAFAREVVEVSVSKVGSTVDAVVVSLVMFWVFFELS